LTKKLEKQSSYVFNIGLNSEDSGEESNHGEAYGYGHKPKKASSLNFIFVEQIQNLIAKVVNV